MSVNYAAIILAAGFSSRMKQHKALLKNSLGKTFLCSIVDLFLTAGIEKIVIVVNNDLLPRLESEITNHPKILIVLNQFPERGRFFSIKLACQNFNDEDFCFIHDVDRPLVKKATIQKIIQHSFTNDYLQPVFETHKGHPITLSNKILNHIKQQNNTDLKLNEVLSSFNATFIEVDDEGVLININTIDEYKRYFPCK